MRGSEIDSSHLVVIRRLTPERLVEAARLAASAWDVPPPEGKLESDLMSPDSVAMIALDPEDPSGPIAGVATATLLGDGLASADDTAVAAEWEGHGVGSLLLDALTRELKRYGVRRIRGQSSERRVGQLPFFLRYGFKVVGERPASEPWFVPGENVFLTELSI